MPRFEPFVGLRYDPARFDPAAVTAPPYDVIDPDDRARLIGRSPHNVVAVDLPVEADGPDRYQQAAGRLAAWQRDGVLVADTRPSLTIHRMDHVDDRGRRAHTLGVIGALELAAPGEGGILPHEQTTPKAKSDRLDLLRATRSNLSAVWGLSLTKGLSDILEVGGDPQWHWTGDDGVTHTVWRLDEPAALRALSEAVGAAPVVIADGHHRYETSLIYRDERRAVDGGDAGPAELVLTYVVELVADQLHVGPIHRLLNGLPADLGPALDPFFEPAGEAAADRSLLDRMDRVGALALVTSTGPARLLRPRPGAFGPNVLDLDSARLDAALAAVPGIQVRFQHGLDPVVRAVTAGDADAGMLLRPATVEAIAGNADTGVRMPPKTTFFGPKPPTGLVIRPLG